MSFIRIPGILQRIAWAYFVVAMMSLYLPRLTTKFESPSVARFDDVISQALLQLLVTSRPFLTDCLCQIQVPGPVGFRVFRFYVLHWAVALLFLWIYVTIMLGVTVPTWSYHLPGQVRNPHLNPQLILTLILS